MADHFYGVDVSGADKAVGNVTKATATTGDTVEVRIHDGAGLSKTQVLLALQAVESFIVVDGAPA